MSSTESTISEDKAILFARWLLVLLVVWFGFWFIFFTWETDSNPLIGTINVTWSTIAVFILPFLFSIAIIFRLTGFNKQKFDISLMSDFAYFSRLAAALVLSFAYVMTAGMILASFAQFAFPGVFLLLVAIPFFFCLFLSKIIKSILLAGIDRFLGSRHFKFLSIITVLTLIFRYPVFLDGEVGVDSYLFHSLTDQLLKTSTFSWALSPLSYFELFPASIIASPMVYVGSISLIMGSSIEIATLVSSVVIGVLSTMTFIVPLKLATKYKLIPSNAFPISYVLYAFMPLLLKFTDWTTSGRQLFFLIAPCAIALLLGEAFDENISLLQRFCTWFLLFYTLLLSHGIGRILLVFGIGLVVTKQVIYWLQVSIESKENRLHRYAIFTKKILWPDSISENWLFCILGVGLLAFPYVLFALGNRSLVGSWILTRSSITSSWDYTPLNSVIAFVIIFTARMGLASPLLVFGLIFLPFSSSKISINQKATLFCLALFFTFFATAMYFYQALSLFIVLFAGYFAIEIGTRGTPFRRNKSISSTTSVPTTLSIRYWIFPIRIQLSGKTSHKKTRHKKDKSETNRKWPAVTFVILCILSGIIIQNTRYIAEGISPTNEFREMSDFLSSVVTDNKTTNVLNNLEWSPRSLEGNDSLSYSEGVLNLTSTYNGTGSDTDWVYANITQVTGWFMVVELRCKVISSEGYVGPYLKVTNQEGLTSYQGQQNEWPLNNALEWRNFAFRITRTQSVSSIGFRFVTDQNRTGPATLLVEDIKITSYPFTALATNRATAQKISAYTPDLPIFPMSNVQYLSTFYDSANYTISTIDFEFSISKIMSIFRTGPYEIQFNVSPNCDSLYDEDSTFEEFRELHTQFRFGLFIHLNTVEWSLLDSLLNHQAIILVDTWGEYDLYLTTLA